MDEEYNLPELWVTKSVYCNLCGHDWQAVYDYNNTTRLKYPHCHEFSRINEISDNN